MIKIKAKKGNKCRLEKLEDLRFNGNHPNGIDKGYITDGILYENIETGKKVFLGRLVTSTVMKIINENTFQTKNSTYKISILSKMP